MVGIVQQRAGFRWWIMYVAHKAELATGRKAHMATYCALQLVGHDGAEHTIVTFPAVIGKSQSADVQIKGNPLISRVHARILHADNRFAVEDLGSTNRTYVQGHRVRPGVPTILSEGDMLCFADAAFRVHLVSYDSQTSMLLREAGVLGSARKGRS